MRKLVRSASGQRHGRWALEIIESMQAHKAENYLLKEEQIKALEAETVLLQPRVDTLATAVKPYRDFIDHAHIGVRAKKRVADYLCDEAQRDAEAAARKRKKDIDLRRSGGYSGLFLKVPFSRILTAGQEKTAEYAEKVASGLRELSEIVPTADTCADALDKAAGVLRSFIQKGKDIDAQRLPLRTAVQKAIFELREALDQMDGRLRTHFSQDFIDSLYPELNRKATAVADEPDEDDDTSEEPEPTEQ
jgi:hypothetical protein